MTEANCSSSALERVSSLLERSSSGAAARERVGHRVEPVGEDAELVLARGGDARVELAGGEAAGRLGDGQHRPDDRAAQIEGEADRRGEHQQEAADAERDGARGTRLRPVRAVGDDRALAAEERREIRPHVREPQAVGVGGQLTAGVGDVPARQRDDELHPEGDVVVDLAGDAPQEHALCRVLRHEALQRAPLDGVLAQRRVRRCEELLLAAGDEPDEAVLDGDQRVLELTAGGERLLRAKRRPRRVALARDRDDQQHEREPEQDRGRGAERDDPRRDPCPETPSQQRLPTFRGPERISPGPAPLERTSNESRTPVAAPGRSAGGA